MPESTGTVPQQPGRSDWLRLFPSWKERLRLVRRQAWLVVALAYLGLAVAYALPADFRNSSPAFVIAVWAAFMVRTFVFHIGLGLLLYAGLAAAARAWRPIVALIPALAFTLGPSIVRQVPRSATETIDGQPLRVMSVNVLAFNTHTDPIVAEIAAADPDLLLIQEYTPGWHEALQAALAERYPHSCIVPQDDCFGLALFSRVPVRGEVQTDVSLGVAGTPQMRAVVTLDGRDIAVYNVHLFPPRSFEYVIEQRQGFADLLDHLRREPLPVIVSGDFNFTRDSPMATALHEAGYRDAHDLAGYGRGTTWPNSGLTRYLPGVRIDHIYLSKELTAVESAVGRGEGSDHRPILAKIGLCR